MSFIKELKRRNVVRVAVAYAVIGWLLLQIADILTPALLLPDWIISAITLVLILGFIPAMLFSWAYEITPEGIKKEKDVDRDNSITAHTAKKLDIVTLFAVIGLAGLIVWQQMFPSSNNVLDDNSITPQVVENNQETAEPPAQVAPITSVSDKSIAVLPFANMANDVANEPFTLGLHDDLLTHLSKISALKVISRTSVLQYKDTTLPIKQIASELGVANILEGGVQRAGNQIRLNVQLIDANTDEHLWAEIYDRELTTENIFKIQTEISQQIAAALKAQLTEQESKSIAKIPTTNLEAYDAYIAAQQLIEKRTGPALKEALALYQKATTLDPNYVDAYVGQAIAYRLLNEYSDLNPIESQALSEPVIAKALELDPLSAKAHLVNAALLDEKGNFNEAEKEYLYSISLNPNIAAAYHWYGHMLRVDLGRASEALEFHRKAAELDPLSSVILVNVGWSLRSNNFMEEALVQFEKVHQADPKFPGAVNGLAWVNDDLGNYAKAVIEQTRAVNLDQGNILNRFWLLLHYLNINDIESATSVLEESKTISPNYVNIPWQEFLLAMNNGDYLTPKRQFLNIVEGSPDRINRNSLAVIAGLNRDCTLSLEQWQQTSPNKFRQNYQSNAAEVFNDLSIAWCLQEVNRAEESNKLLSAIEKIIQIGPTDTQGFFQKMGYLAVSGNSSQAAQVYADIVKSKRTRGWYWVDHLPQYNDMRQEAAFIQARQQLMKDLKEQQQLLGQLTNPDSSQ